MRRIAAACAVLSLLTLTGCFVSRPRTQQYRESAVQEDRFTSDEQLARNAYISLVNSVDKKDLDNFIRFSDLQFLTEASGGDTEKTKEDMEKEDWTIFFDTGNVDSIGNGIQVKDLKEKLSYLEGSESYPYIDLSRVTDAYRFDSETAGQIYVVRIDGEWKVDLALFNVAEMWKNDSKRNS